MDSSRSPCRHQDCSRSRADLDAKYLTTCSNANHTHHRGQTKTQTQTQTNHNHNYKRKKRKVDLSSELGRPSSPAAATSGATMRPKPQRAPATPSRSWARRRKRPELLVSALLAFTLLQLTCDIKLAQPDHQNPNQSQHYHHDHDHKAHLHRQASQRGHEPSESLWSWISNFSFNFNINFEFKPTSLVKLASCLQFEGETTKPHFKVAPSDVSAQANGSVWIECIVANYDGDADGLKWHHNGMTISIGQLKPHRSLYYSLPANWSDQLSSTSDLSLASSPGDSGAGAAAAAALSVAQPPVTVNYSLQIKRVGLDDEGEYSCEFVGKTLSRSAQSKLTVLKAPEWLRVDAYATHLANRDPDHKDPWTQHNAADDSYSSERHGDTFWPDQPIELRSALIADEQVQVVTVRQNSRLRLECQSGEAKPAAQLEWVDHNQRPVPLVHSRPQSEPPIGYFVMAPTAKASPADTVLGSSHKLATSKLTLELSKVDKYFAGFVFTCHAHHPSLNPNESSSDSTTRQTFERKIKLEILYEPEVRLHLTTPSGRNENSFIESENSSVKFDCEARGEPNSINYRWFIDEHEVTRAANEPQLVIGQVTRQLHKRTVKCEASNSIGTGSAEQVISVKYGPKFVSHLVMDSSVATGSGLQPEPVLASDLRKEGPSAQARIAHLSSTSTTSGGAQTNLGLSQTHLGSLGDSVARAEELWASRGQHLTVRLLNSELKKHLSCDFDSNPRVHRVTWYKLPSSFGGYNTSLSGVVPGAESDFYIKFGGSWWLNDNFGWQSGLSTPSAGHLEPLEWRIERALGKPESSQRLLDTLDRWLTTSGLNASVETSRGPIAMVSAKLNEPLDWAWEPLAEAPDDATGDATPLGYRDLAVARRRRRRNQAPTGAGQLRLFEGSPGKRTKLLARDAELSRSEIRVDASRSIAAIYVCEAQPVNEHNLNHNHNYKPKDTSLHLNHNLAFAPTAKAIHLVESAPSRIVSSREQLVDFREPSNTIQVECLCQINANVSQQNQVAWFRGSKSIEEIARSQPSGRKKFELRVDYSADFLFMRSKLIIKFADSSDFGKYECRIDNDKLEIELMQRHWRPDFKSLSMASLALLSLAICLLLFCSVILGVRKQKAKAKQFSAIETKLARPLEGSAGFGHNPESDEPLTATTNTTSGSGSDTSSVGGSRAPHPSGDASKDERRDCQSPASEGANAGATGRGHVSAKFAAIHDSLGQHMGARESDVQDSASASASASADCATVKCDTISQLEMPPNSLINRFWSKLTSSSSANRSNANTNARSSTLGRSSRRSFGSQRHSRPAISGPLGVAPGRPERSSSLSGRHETSSDSGAATLVGLSNVNSAVQAFGLHTMGVSGVSAGGHNHSHNNFLASSSANLIHDSTTTSDATGSGSSRSSSSTGQHHNHNHHQHHQSQLQQQQLVMQQQQHQTQQLHLSNPYAFTTSPVYHTSPTAHLDGQILDVGVGMGVYGHPDPQQQSLDNCSIAQQHHSPLYSNSLQMQMQMQLDMQAQAQMQYLAHQLHLQHHQQYHPNTQMDTNHYRMPTATVMQQLNNNVNANGASSGSHHSSSELGSYATNHSAPIEQVQVNSINHLNHGQHHAMMVQTSDPASDDFYETNYGTLLSQSSIYKKLQSGPANYATNHLGTTTTLGLGGHQMMVSASNSNNNSTTGGSMASSASSPASQLQVPNVQVSAAINSLQLNSLDGRLASSSPPTSNLVISQQHLELAEAAKVATHV